MKQTNILTIVLFSLCTFLFSSCSEDSLAPISLQGMDNPSINLRYPRTGVYDITVEGGDGNYTVVCDKPEIVEAKIITDANAPAKLLSLKVLDRGKAIVTITDNSQNSLVVNVTTDYLTERFVVSQYDIEISGDLRDSEKKEITEKALATVPVKRGGGYQFVFIDEESSTGKVLMYPEKFGGKAIEGTFKTELTNIGPEGAEEILYPAYELTLPEGQRSFLFYPYRRSARMSVTPVVAFYEDVKEMFIGDYPLAERVYTTQVLSRPSEIYY